MPQHSPPMNRAQKREANRARILEAACAVFMEDGFQAATIDEIAQRAGLSNGAIYYNFDSKADLLMALLDARLEERIEVMRRTLAPEKLAGRGGDVLAVEARAMSRSVREEQAWRLLVLEFTVHAARTPALQPKLREYQLRQRRAVTEAFAPRLKAAGVTPPMPVARFAQLALAVVDGLAIQEIADPGSTPPQFLRDISALILSAGAEL
jgi:AcrR family transcriptional regulator